VGDAGVVVPPRDPDALAGALARLLGDADARRKLGEAGRARAGSFLWEDVVAALEETYARARGLVPA
jgi:glycosyltransferase involved in cell wall biosynthesis